MANKKLKSLNFGGEDTYYPEVSWDNVTGKPEDNSYTLTDEDKNEIVQAVLDSMGAVVYGYVDENNNIVLTGTLPEATYSIKYEMEDGSTLDIGDLVLDSNVYYTVTSDLTYCTNSNSETQAVSGGSYSATITANDGYSLSSVAVTMGGTDISSSAVSSGTISIASVTGDIVITAVAEEAVAAESVTVDIELTNGIRVGSDGGDRAAAGCCATPHIDLTNIPKPCTIHLSKAEWCNTSATEYSGYVMTYAKKADGTALIARYTNEGMADAYVTVVKNGGSKGDVTVTVTSDDVGYIRFSGIWTSGYSDSSVSFDAANTKATLTYTPVS